MRPWEREQPSSSSPAPDSSSPPTPTLRPAKGSLSSLVVKPSADELAISRQDDAPAAEKPTPEPRHRPSPAESYSPPRRPRPRWPPEDSGHNLSVHSASLCPRQRTIDRRYDHYFDHHGRPQGRRGIRDENNGGGFRDHSPMYGRGRGRANVREISPPYAHTPEGGRFKEYSRIEGHGRGGRLRLTQFDRGGGRHFRDISPPAFERERNGQRYLFPAYEKERGRERLHFSPSYSPDRDGQRFRDVSPIYDTERGGGRFRGTPPLYGQRKDARLFNRNFDGPESEPLPFRDEGTNHNNPNIPPRVGDWICRNPSCGNLNFARREYCNNCDKFRYEPGEGVRSSSPCRRYSGGPDPMDHQALIQPMDCGLRREINGYRSPPRDWARDSPRGPPSRHGGKFSDIPVGRETVEYRRDIGGYRGKDKFNRVPPRDWNHQVRGPAELLQDRRGYDRVDDFWGPRERSRSPIKSLPLKVRRYGHDDDGWVPKKRSRSPIRSLPPKVKRHDHDDDGWGPRERSQSPIRSLAPKDSGHAPFGGRGRGYKRAIA